jgi:hypothetical protein
MPVLEKPIGLFGPRIPTLGSLIQWGGDASTIFAASKTAECVGDKSCLYAGPKLLNVYNMLADDFFGHAAISASMRQGRCGGSDPLESASELLISDPTVSKTL